MKSKKIYFGISITISLLLIFILSSDFIIPLTPKDNAVLRERLPSFRWLGAADKLIIDDNEQFISPIVEEVKGNSHHIKHELNFTTYYWKLAGKRETSARKFSIDSIVALQLKKGNILANLTNTGTADLNVEIQEKAGPSWKITGEVVLQRNESRTFEVKNSTLFIGKQK